ncbi:major facilitator superfamily protein [Paecilomyces variotii No. 5]|uniref:Major facilitator superfamily protein n=1 Tax=Byssochlamys spectabilis (strain No. 5 / NBRC 109023) TaxID=1356009 RepID=V5HRM5_BYSSN|nr:major facilitator superfamily protein [Paecilomyces variotii No. 5]
MGQQDTPVEMTTRTPEEKKDFPVLAHKRFLFFSFFVGFSMLEYGFDSGEISSFQAMVGFLKVFGYKDPHVPTGWNIASTPQQIISSFVLLGSFIASLLAGLFARFLGRRHSVMVGLVLLIVGVTVQIVTTNLGALYFGRLVTGLANGFIMNFTFVYIAEMSPAHLRGVAYGLATGWVTLGAAVGYVITNATQGITSRLSYQIPLYTLYLIPVVMIISLFFLPESPRWLLLHGKPEQALKSLTWIRGGACTRFEVLQEYEEMKLNVEHEIMNRSNVRFTDQFTKKHIRRTLVSVGVGMVNPAVAGMFMMAFMTYFMQVAGVEDPFKWGVMVQFIGYFGQLISYPFIAMFGRRTMLLIGSGICGLSMLILGILYTPHITDPVARAKGVIFCMTLYQFGFNFGVVGLVYMVSGEIPAQNLRSHTAGLSIGTGFIFAWLTAFTAPYFINPAELNWVGKYGFIWFVSTVITMLFIVFFVPEVRGRTLEEIEEMFDKGVPAWQFQTYVCEGAEQARKEAEQDYIHEEAKEGAEHIEEAKI